MSSDVVSNTSSAASPSRARRALSAHSFLASSAAVVYYQLVVSGHANITAVGGVDDQRKDGGCETCVQECGVDRRRRYETVVILSAIGGTLG